MKKSFKTVLAFLTVCAITFYLNSCKDKEHSAPAVYFNSTIPYIYDDTTLTAGTTFAIYVQANEEGVNDLLESGQISVSINGGPDSVIQTMSFVSDVFNQGYAYKAGATGTYAKFVFTFATQSGVAGSDSLILHYN